MVTYNPCSGWYRIPMKHGPDLVRYFHEGQAWLCHPTEFFEPKLAAENFDLPVPSPSADIQMRFTECCKEMICRGPVEQYHPANWDAVSDMPELLQAN